MAIFFSSLFTSGENIKVKWKEPYVSEALNVKNAVAIPRGFYRGFRFSSNANPLTITVAPDSGTNDHIAVYEVNAGDNALTKYSLTIRKTGSFNLDLTALANNIVYICLYANYTTSATTTAELRAYTVAEYNALSATLKGELLILGTIDVPAAGTIPVGNWEYTNRFLAAENSTTENREWPQLVQNSGFEWGATTLTGKYAIPAWEQTVSNADRHFAVVQTPSTGDKALSVVADTTTGNEIDIFQEIGFPVKTGQLCRLVISYRRMQTISGDPIYAQLWLSSGTTMQTSGTFDVEIPQGAAMGSFTTLEKTFEIGTEDWIRGVSIHSDNIEAPATGNMILFDDFKLFVEPLKGSAGPYARESLVKPLLTRKLVLEESGIPGIDQGLVMTVKNDVDLFLERKDASTTNTNQPNLDLSGLIKNLGNNLLSTVSDALKPRISGLAKTSGYTLLLEWHDASEKYARIYTNGTGQLIVTSNAKYDGTNWIKDVNGQAAMMVKVDNSNMKGYSQASGTNTWADGAWTESALKIGTDIIHSGNINPETVGGGSVGNTNALAILGTRTASVDNTSGTAAYTLRVKAKTAQTRDNAPIKIEHGTDDTSYGPIIDIVGKNSLTGTFFDSYGFIRPIGEYFHDPMEYTFTTDGQNTLEGSWSTATAFGGSVNSSDYSYVQIITGSTNNAYGYMARGMLSSKTHRPVVRFAVSLHESLNDRLDAMGINGVAEVHYDTATYGNGSNFRLVTPGGGAAVDLGYAPALGTLYVITIAIIADNKIDITIGGAVVPVTLTTYVAPATYTQTMSAAEGAVYVWCKNTGVADKRLRVHSVDYFTRRLANII